MLAFYHHSAHVLGGAVRAVASVALFWLVAQIPVSVTQAAPTVTSCGPAVVTSAYSITLCITVTSTTMTGVQPVTSSLIITGSKPGIQKVVYTLGSTYLLTDFSPPRSFNLPSNKWMDGAYTLTASLYLSSNPGTPVSPVNLSLTFSNGNGSTPINNSVFAPVLGTTPASGQPFVIGVAGDGAGGEQNSADVTNLIASWNPNMHLYLGDVYDEGSKAEFYNWYAPNAYFGRFKSITNPTVGNHEYVMAPNPSIPWSPEGYVDYWGQPPTGTQWWYSIDVAGWHILSLNTNCLDAGGCQASPTPSAQYTWLQNDLQAHPNPCTLAFYHEPLWDIGPEGATPPNIADIWNLLAAKRVKLVLNGHDHNYQRWKPLDGAGNVSSTGVTEFVVGTGGHGIQSFATTDSRLAVGYASPTNPITFGALKLNLYSYKADYFYVNTAGATLDSGSILCGTPPKPSLFLPMLLK